MKIRGRRFVMGGRHACAAQRGYVHNYCTAVWGHMINMLLCAQATYPRPPPVTTATLPATENSLLIARGACATVFIVSRTLTKCNRLNSNLQLCNNAGVNLIERE